MMPLQPQTSLVQADLRILATSDVHGYIESGDALTQAPWPSHGLARLAKRINDARHAATGAVLLFDNGDMLQGTAVADECARQPATATHPILATMHTLAYDVMGLGNHDFDYGTAYVEAFANHAAFPVLCANARLPEPSSIQRSTILQVDVPCSDGVQRALRVGVVSAMPQQTQGWLKGKVADPPQFDAPLTALRREIADLRVTGVDIVIVLAHGGFVAHAPEDSPENFALFLAETEAVDVIIAGHTHQCWPGADFVDVPGMDVARGTAHNVPAVMPGYGASHLGCIDLKLEMDAAGAWTVHTSDVSLVAAKGCEPDPDIDALMIETRASMTRHLSEPIGTTRHRLHSYFSLVHPDNVVDTLAGAYLTAVDPSVLPNNMRHLPRLASVSVNRCGGRAGPLHYMDLAEGPLTRDALIQFCPFDEDLIARDMTGADIVEWLERSASLFCQLDPSLSEQPLVNPLHASFNFDVLSGVSIVFDPRCPARYDENGRLINRGAHRVVSLTASGQPVTPDQRFVVIMNAYRANGGGGFPAPAKDALDVGLGVTQRKAVETYLGMTYRVRLESVDWRFEQNLQLSAYLDTGGGAVQQMDDIARFEPRLMGLTEDGFQRVLLKL